MNKTLIITGRATEYLDYMLAAAIALKHFKSADLLSSSRRHLPEYLDNVKDYSQIIILGVSLVGDVELLAHALKALKKKGVKVVWISGIPIPEWIGADVRDNLECYESHSGNVSVAVAEYYGMDYSEWAEYADGNNPLYQKYMEFVDAAEYDYRNYHDEQITQQIIRHIAAHHTDAQWTASERRIIEHVRRYGHRQFVGKSAVNMKIQDDVNRIAPHEHAKVLILGESGTGKETAATQIHFKSPRREELFKVFNCAIVNTQMSESIFLGYKKGAFTGANEDRAGLFEVANGGTLLLDEIGELPLEAQGVLLRVIDEGRFYRVGDNEKEIEVDVRVIAATNRDLAAMVRNGKFRLDLYQRLSVIQLHIPPLREHKEDIPYIAHEFRKKNHMGGWLASAQVEALQSYDYPGNVRELNNLLERAFVLGIDDYSQLIKEHREINATFLPQDKAEAPDNLEEAIRIHVKRVSEKYSHNITKTAEALGVARNTVRKYLE